MYNKYDITCSPSKSGVVLITIYYLKKIMKKILNSIISSALLLILTCFRLLYPPSLQSVYSFHLICLGGKEFFPLFGWGKKGKKFGWAMVFEPDLTKLFLPKLLGGQEEGSMCFLLNIKTSNQIKQRQKTVHTQLCLTWLDQTKSL